MIKEDPDEDLREMCVKALVEMEHDDIYDGLHHALTQDSEEDVRAAAARYLEDHPRRESIEPLCDALLDDAKRIVRHAIDGLDNLGLSEASGCLRTAAKDTADDDPARKMNEVATELER